MRLSREFGAVVVEVLAVDDEDFFDRDAAALREG